MTERREPVTAVEAPRSVYTSSLAPLLQKLGISLVVSTYQAGQVILVRHDGNTVNTRFRAYDQAMGLAVDEGRLAIGSRNAIWTLRDMPAVARKLDPPGTYDACYLPRRMHVTGDIDVHEMAYDAQHELWLVNTRFGCLCTLDADHSFVPRWKPPFLGSLAPEDRCHLNGLGMKDGRPRYATALGETNTKGAWRTNKADGGILLDVDSDQILLRGLSMPHSPRWYQDQLWLLESGRGSLTRVDPVRGSKTDVARMPGFTRGLDFYGPLAFIGLSQVRETAHFDEIPVTRDGVERSCGVWVIDLRTGETVAFLRFETVVQEIFAVQVLSHARFPEILDHDDERLSVSYTIPDELLKSPGNQESLLSLESSTRSAGDSASHQWQVTRPGNFETAYRQGTALSEAGQLEMARSALELALGLQPDHPQAWCTLADVHAALDELDMALECYARSLDLDPEFAKAHVNRGLAMLEQGDFEQGFGEIAWQRRLSRLLPAGCSDSAVGPGSLAGRRLLVLAAPGASDTIQFIRFLPRLAALADTVTLMAPEPMLGLLRTAEGLHELRPIGRVEPKEFDVCLPLMSLPGLLGLDQEGVRAEPPYLAPPRDRPSIPDPGPGASLTVGLVWTDEAHGSIPIELLPGLLDLAGLTIYNLQAGEHANAVADLWRGNASVHDLSTAIDDWATRAGYISQLDLVVGVDSATMHLAGALGKPAWVLLGPRPHWCWMREGDVGPWYPTLRLIRRDPDAGWPGQIEQVRQALKQAARADRRR